MAKINSVKTVVDGHEFDSLTESEFYRYLKTLEEVDKIIVHPSFILLAPFEIKCGRCFRGKVKSPKTGKPIQCKRCEGTGQITRQKWSYTPDFVVIWKNGAQSFYDVKGGWKDPKFNYVKKMFEKIHGQELLVVKPTKSGWKYM